MTPPPGAGDPFEQTREAGADLHHRWHIEGIKGRADAAAHVIARARESGVDERTCIDMATETFQQIMGQVAPPKKPFAWLRRGRPPAEPAPARLVGSAAPPALPPGDRPN
jgi:hypothetical protein